MTAWPPEGSSAAPQPGQSNSRVMGVPRTTDDGRLLQVESEGDFAAADGAVDDELQVGGAGGYVEDQERVRERLGGDSGVHLVARFLAQQPAQGLKVGGGPRVI